MTAFTRTCRPMAAILLAALAAGVVEPTPRARAAVVVVANRTDGEVRFAAWSEGGPPKSYQLKPGELTPLPAESELGIAFRRDVGERRYRLALNSIYHFTEREGGVDLFRAPLGHVPRRVASAAATAAGRAAGAESPPDSPPPTSPATIGVKLLVDDDEPAVRRVWEKRLRERLEAASEIIARHAPVRFEVVAVDTWESDDAEFDFGRSLAEFERKVDPSPARLAVGFTSQYQITRGRTHLGGTRGSLGSHILIREWSQHVSWTERLEILVHELGHFLGAAHSPEPDSVMRPMLGDRQSHARDFQIRFDPANTLVVYLVGEELRRRPETRMHDIRAETAAHLAAAYRLIAESMPDDPAVATQLRLIER